MEIYSQKWINLYGFNRYDAAIFSIMMVGELGMELVKTTMLLHYHARFGQVAIYVATDTKRFSNVCEFIPCVSRTILYELQQRPHVKSPP